MAIVGGETLRMLLTSAFWRMAIFWPIALVYSYILLLVGDATAYFGPPPVSPPSGGFSSGLPQQGKTPVCVVTGATSGLGAEAAKVLAGKGFLVVLVGRSNRLLSETMQEIKQHNNDAKLKAFVVDISSIQSIIHFKSSLQEWLSESGMDPSIQLLINNAGILAKTSRTTADGYDQMMETNYIGPFVLTNLLWPLLRKCNVPSRIVNVTSFTHRCVSKSPVLTAHNLKFCMSGFENYPFSRTYEFTKFWLLLFSYELHRKICLMDQYPKVSILAADPGTIETNIMRELPKPISKLAITSLKQTRLLGTLEAGVSSIIDAALAPPEISGKYFFGGKGRTIQSSALSYDSKLSRELWDYSMAIFHESMARMKYSIETMDGAEMPF